MPTISKVFSFENALFSPVSSYYDETLGEEVADYGELVLTFTQFTEGTVALFIYNNAEPHNDLEYGIKVFDYGTEKDCKEEAYNSFIRQKAAAKEGLAPPAHFMVRVTKKGRVCYGYTTSVADYTQYVLLPEVEASGMYDDYVICFEIDKKEAINNTTRITQIDSFNSLHEVADNLLAELEEINPMDFDAWACYNEYDIVDTYQLQSKLEAVQVSIDGREVYLGGDLHSGNIGYYKGDLVCVDFSHHSEGM
jgi:hypothetical protein